MLWDRGQDRGYLSLFMTSSDPEMVSFTKPAQPRRVKKYICMYTKNCRSHPAGQKMIFIRGVIRNVR